MASPLLAVPVEIISVHGQNVRPDRSSSTVVQTFFIDDSRINKIMWLQRVQQVSTSGVIVSWLFIAKHSEVETTGVVERERERERKREREREVGERESEDQNSRSMTRYHVWRTHMPLHVIHYVWLC